MAWEALRFYLSLIACPAAPWPQLAVTVLGVVMGFRWNWRGWGTQPASHMGGSGLHPWMYAAKGASEHAHDHHTCEACSWGA